MRKFTENKLKQPFEQIWEPVVDPNTVTKDRYKGCMIPYYRFTGKQKHGISVIGDGGIKYSGEIVKALADKHRTFLPHKTVNHRKYQRWCTHKINSAVLQGVLQGDSVNTMAKRLESVTRMDRDAALSNARTMVTSAENKARMDTAEKASEKGVITKKVWIYTHDLKASSTSQATLQTNVHS